MNRAIFGIILVVVVGFITWGAWVRTSDRLGWNETGAGGRGRTETSALPTGGASHESGNLAAESVTVDGMVFELTSTALTVLTLDGDKLVLASRPWQFAVQAGFAIQPGDRIRLTGFWENETFEPTRLENLQSRQVVQLRDDTGHPNWSGRGRGGR